MISPESWGENLLSKHHIATTLANWGAKIWFLAPYSPRAETQICKPHNNINLIAHKNFVGLNFMYAPLARIISRIEVRNLCNRIGVSIADLKVKL